VHCQHRIYHKWLKPVEVGRPTSTREIDWKNPAKQSPTSLNRYLSCRGLSTPEGKVVSYALPESDQSAPPVHTRPTLPVSTLSREFVLPHSPLSECVYPGTIYPANSSKLKTYAYLLAIMKDKETKNKLTPMLPDKHPVKLRPSNLVLVAGFH